MKDIIYAHLLCVCVCVFLFIYLFLFIIFILGKYYLVDAGYPLGK